MVLVAKVKKARSAPAVKEAPSISIEVEERLVPPWCGALMEVSLWLAVLSGVLFWTTSAAAAARWGAVAFVALSAVMWGCHWYYLRRGAILLSLPLGLCVVPLVVVYLLALAFGLNGLSIVAHAPVLLRVALCVLVFLIVSGAFTERQAARLCAFLGGVGVVEALTALRLLGPDRSLQRPPSMFSFWPQEAGAGVSGTLGTEWALGAVLLCGLVGAATFGAYAVTAGAPSRREVSFWAGTSWIGSRGASKLFTALAALAVMLVALFLVDSILIAPICLGSLALFFILLAAKGRLGSPHALIAVVLCLTFGAASLARPRGVKWGLSGRVLQANLRNLLAGTNDRAAGPGAAAETDGGTTEDARGDRPSKPIHIRNGDLMLVGRETVWLVGALLAGLVVCLLATAIRGVVRFDGHQPILAAGGLAAVAGMALFALFGRSLNHLGVALAVSALCAIAATGGDFEQELEEP